MREQEYRSRDKKVQKMTRNGLVEENRTRGTTEHISKREIDTAFRGAEDTPGRENVGEEAEISLDSRGAMRDAGDKPVMTSRPAAKRDESADVHADRSKHRQYRRKADRGAGEPTGRNRQGRSALSRQTRARMSAADPLSEADRHGSEDGKSRFTPENRLKSDKRDVRTRLRYLPEELPAGAPKEKRDGGKETGRYERAKKQMAAAEKKLADARADIPVRSRSRPVRRFDQGAGKSGGRLRFEKEELRAPLRSGTDTPGRVLTTAARGGIHQKLGEAEKDNLGVEAVHRVDMAAEAGTIVSGQHRRRVREKPYRTLRRAELRLSKANTELEYRKLVQDDQSLQKKSLARWIQKRKIRQKYAAAARESAKGAKHTANVLNKSGQVVRAAAKAVSKKTMFGMVAAAALFVALSGVIFTSCGAMLSGVQSAIIATCYVADEEPINQSDLYYSEMETDIQISINKTEQDFPGYDEYLYNVGEISHNPYELMGYLSAVYEDFTYAQVEAELERLFGLQYRLNREEIVETRTREDENGEEEEYEWRILKTTLTVRPLSEIIAASLAPGEQSDRYGVYMQTCGNRQCYGNPFDFSWIARVTSPYGYRVHPITGEKNLHRGVDIGAAEGTPIRAVQDGRVVSAGYSGGYGLCVVIEDENGYQSKYAHCASVSVSAGQEVERGAVIAAVGNTGSSTGAHLHLEVLHNGAYLNPYYFVDSGG